ncbi:GIY-YIG nuclease family protein [Clavibacter michiganensis subsp. michiganensis]|uniref:GIY-YIG nuclease family protein n=1 Tax=Clavibacter michiganensis TaxID=28447 RepID=UPI0013651BF3|nr:GIY-YIG nuclease family protein [Clavibacter michiganensis subsp. michiganensis]
MSDSDFRSIFDSDEDGLLDTPEKAPKLTSVDRLERSFLEIVEFYREYRREPRSDTREIAERKLGSRLDGILANEDKVAALKHLDEFELLAEPEAPATLEDLLGGDALGLLDDDSGLLDTSDLPARARRIDPDEVAQRIKSLDFDAFEPLFRQKHEELRTGLSKLVSFGTAGGQRAIKEGSFFVLSGVMLFVAEISEPQAAPGVRTRYKPRTRTIFENGTESNLFRRSLAGQLYENDGLAVVPAVFEELLAEDEATGYVYVVRSLSDDPQIQEVPNLHKIGFSRGPVEKRIANAESEPTYLMAPVELVASYRTYNLKTSALEHLLHRVFSEKRLRLSQVGKDGRVYEPSEWYSVPLRVVNQAIDLITSGDIVDYEYDAEARKLRLRP